MYLCISWTLWTPMTWFINSRDIHVWSHLFLLLLYRTSSVFPLMRCPDQWMINRSFVFWHTSNYHLFFFFLRQRPFGNWPVFLRALPSIMAGKPWLVQVPALALGFPLVGLEFCSSLSPMWTLKCCSSSVGTSLHVQESTESVCHVRGRNPHVTHLFILCLVALLIPSCTSKLCPSWTREEAHLTNH